MKKNSYTAKIIQDGIMVAGVDGPTIKAVEKEIKHYALMYSQDGELEIKRNYKVK
jgi:hypothetical protein